MKTKWFSWDERSAQVAGRSAMIMLGITQVALGAMLLVRRYVFDQPAKQVKDIQWILLGSIIGYFALRSFLGGIMPVPTLKQAVIIYLGLTAVLFVTLSLWLGLPSLDEWATTFLPAILGPALIFGGYSLMAYPGRKRIDRLSEEE